MDRFVVITLGALLTAAVVMGVTAAVSKRVDRVAVVDIAWGSVFVAIALVLALVWPDTHSWLLAVLGMTDWVDGYLARRLGQVSELGKALDPIADRLALVVGFGSILAIGAAPWWVAGLALAREVGVSAAVLVLEILAGRLLAPYVGTGLETYTGIIGTVLAGIALGTEVGVTPADYAHDEVKGLLVGLDAGEVVVERIDERAGTVHVHFPRVGYHVKVIRKDVP